jgi:UDP-GlcNAc3NAcA epimerase
MAEKKSELLDTLGIKPFEFVLCTIHRDNNTDVPERLSSIFRAMLTIANSFDKKIVIPLHPRTAKLLPSQLSGELYQKVKNCANILVIPPVSYLEMILLEKHCNLVLTDSGGVQKEAYFFEKPLIIARPETEWIEIVEHGAGIIADADEKSIVEAYSHFNRTALSFPPVFGDGNAGKFICTTLLNNTGNA